jgi:hypothetical protein
MATLALGGVKEVAVQHDVADGFDTIPAVLSADVSTDSSTITLADGHDINSGYKATITVETLDIDESADWFVTTKAIFDDPFSDDGSTNNYQVKLTMKDGDTVTFDNVRVSGIDLVAGADGEYSRYVLSFNCVSTDVVTATTLSIS